jgi:hypothetical protein
MEGGVPPSTQPVGPTPNEGTLCPSAVWRRCLAVTAVAIPSHPIEVRPRAAIGLTIVPPPASHVSPVCRSRHYG